ncbi:MAG: type II toxin-antitoxin system HipA family toxin [Planctomycetes bacterium]|nr:type II toxin-antitoxin system HipA family toxin [Planctomycetota bacterium]
MSTRRIIDVVADWTGLAGPTRVGALTATPARGKEVFAFEYDDGWLRDGHGHVMDPALQLYRGPQYPSAERQQFGVFLDSAPDRWGRVLMRRREALRARREQRPERVLLESDYLLGVHDAHRIGALRYRVEQRFLDDDEALAAPPWTSLRELQNASLQLERDDVEHDPDYERWLRMLVSPGGSLGGARPKASVRDERGRLWIAKFPSRHDENDVGAWEMVVHRLAAAAGIDVPEARLDVFGRGAANRQGHRTFSSRRFDRDDDGRRRHFTSAMTMLGRSDGEQGHADASYLELAGVLMQHGSQPTEDLAQLWRRVAFSVCVSNTDDHLRNHGFLHEGNGVRLAPAYDLNANPDGNGLTLNISETDNTQDLGLLLQVAEWFRLRPPAAGTILDTVRNAVRGWRDVASQLGLGAATQQRMARAFRLVE